MQPIDRYLGEGPSEQYALLYCSARQGISIDKGCSCVGPVVHTGYDISSNNYAELRGRAKQ